MHTTIEVELGERSYPIVIGRGLLGGAFELSTYIRGDDCLVVSNETVAPLYLEKLLPNLEGRVVTSVSLPDGEAHKTLATMESVLDKLVAMGAKCFRERVCGYRFERSRNATAVCVAVGVVVGVAVAK